MARPPHPLLLASPLLNARSAASLNQFECLSRLSIHSFICVFLSVFGRFDKCLLRNFPIFSYKRHQQLKKSWPPISHEELECGL